MLDPDCLKRVRVEAEQVQDGRRDLGRLHGHTDEVAVSQPREHDQDRNVTVLLVVPAVLGDLALTACVHDAVPGDTDDVGMPWAGPLRPAAAIGDRVMIERLVTNLLDNAVRYNTPGD